jgi:hypothetical protein
MLRDINLDVKRIVWTRALAWAGDRITVRIADHFKVLAQSEFWFSYNLINGLHESLLLAPGQWVPSMSARAVPYDVLPEYAFITLRTGNRGWVADMRSADVTLYINKWTEDVELQGVLDVIRDSVMAGNTKYANQLGRQHIPHSYDLFAALVRREQTLLKGAIR